MILKDFFGQHVFDLYKIKRILSKLLSFFFLYPLLDD